MTRICALVVVRDEAERLRSLLPDLAAKVDVVTVYDDGSVDDTAAVVQQAGCLLAHRPLQVPAWAAHEGQCRQAAWDWAAQAADLEPGDWIVVLDADEWLMHAEVEGFRERLRSHLDRIPSHHNAMLIQKYEVFGFDTDGTPMVRMDGYWGNIIGTRVARWLPGGSFADKAMGSGCEPTYVERAPYHQNGGFYLVHYGYATREGQLAKHQRYTSIKNHGHSQSHIDSIIAEPQLRRFWLRYPKM